MRKESLIELFRDEEVRKSLIEILKDEFVLVAKEEAQLNETSIDKKQEEKEKSDNNELYKQIEELNHQLDSEREQRKEMGKFVDKIKELLGVSGKKEIEEKIISNDNELRNLRNEKKKLENEINLLIDETKQMKKVKENLNLELDKIQKKLDKKRDEINEVSDKNNKLSSKIDFYRDSFEEDLKAYNLYTELSDSTRDSLKGIFKDNSLKGFIACGIQDRNISSLWEYVKDEIREERNSDIPKLKEIFGFLFRRYQMAYPIFEVQNVETGDNFSDSDFIRHSSSVNVNGAISEVVFRGWVNTKTNKIVKKTIVKMG